ncbi:MAG: DUF1566 domain-containing protein [Candidatus Binatia bacterium]
MTILARASLAVAVLLMVAVTPAGAETGTQTCERAVLRATATYWSCLFRARGDAALRAAPPDFRFCVERIWRRRSRLFKKYGTACPQNLWLGGTQRFVDQGDDTVLDQATGLEWEKKRALDGKANPADPRDGDNLYTWTATRGGKDSDGTAFTSFLVGLNKPECFAKHCDWRLPTYAELQTILVSTEPCSPKPCLDPIFGPTATGIYWSGEESVYHPVRAWYVFFIGGLKTTAPKDTRQHVRAVRRHQ